MIADKRHARAIEIFWIFFTLLFTLLALAKMPLDQAAFFTFACLLLYTPGAIATLHFIERRLTKIEFHLLSFIIGTAMMSFAVFAFSHLLPIRPLIIFISEAGSLFILINIKWVQGLRAGRTGRKK